MATGIEQAQSHVSTCPEHTHQLLLSYCRTCHKRVCEKCVKGPHSEHDWTFLQNHVREVRNEGKEIAKEIREEVIAYLRAKLEGAAKEEEVTKIRRMQASLKNFIDEYADEMVSQLDDDDLGSDFEREIDEFEKLADFFEKKVQIEYNSVVVDMEEELYAKLQQHRTSKAATQANGRRYQEGSVDGNMIQTMMGRVEKVNEDPSTAKVNVTVVKTLTHGSEIIVGIKPVADNMVWLHRSKSANVPLIDMDGTEREMKNFGTLFTDFTVTDESHLFTFRDRKYIGCLLSGEISKFCSTAPLSPNGVCHSRDGGLLVCLADCSLSDIKSSSQGEVHHMDMSGRIKKRYYQDESHHTKLFTFPYRVAQNINSDFCVCDFIERHEIHKLVVVKEDSRVRFIYEGHSSLKKKCTANSVACDAYGRIILSDSYNHAIHMLSADGQFIQFLLTSKEGLSYPTALALHEDTLWVGNADGVIKICKLKQRSKQVQI